MMQCRACRSENVRRFEGELTASSPELENVTTDPVYVCQQVSVCVDCGFTELVIPPEDLRKLEKIKAASS
jgi:hypothetical protein